MVNMSTAKQLGWGYKTNGRWWYW